MMKKYNTPGDIHFVTTRIYKKQNFFKDDKCCQLFLDNLDFYRKKYDLKVYGYCIMPDHVHLLIYFDMEKNPELTISMVIHGIKGYSAKLINEHLTKNKYLSPSGRQGSYALPSKGRGTGASATRRGWVKIWQPSFYDFNIYSEDKFFEKLDYIHMNPVKAGIIDDISKYKYCSWINYELEDNRIFLIDNYNI